MISLIPELCYITGLTDEMRANFRLMKAIHQHTRVSPEQRHAAMKKFIRSVKENGKASSIMGAWGMSLEDDTVDLMVRTIFISYGYMRKVIYSLPQTNVRDLENVEFDL